MTLYTYDRDTEGKSTCTGTCATNWPPYKAEGDSSAALQDNVGTIKRDDGSAQYTWNGAPLYLYIQDKEKGDVTGDGVGDVWHVAK
jgi:predicted lipoprotein with Yx(FWY)xxD motif